MIAEGEPAHAVHLVFAAVASLVALAAVTALDRPASPLDRLRSRLVYGVPWGTLVVVAFVCAVYLFVQRGIEAPSNPVVIPFRAWSYAAPEGLLWSSFAHASRDHLVGNVVSAIVAGTLAEHAFGHYPPQATANSTASDSTASDSTASDSTTPEREVTGTSWVARVHATLRTSPLARAVVVFPLATVGFGVLSALFVLGPVIGFSGVVFALWGFALVWYPVGTLASLSGVTLAYVGYETLRAPVEFAEATPSFGPPGWANVAIQGHALGLVAGVLAAVWLRRSRRTGEDDVETLDGSEHEPGGRRRGTDPGFGPVRHPAIVVFLAVSFFGASRRLWAVYWYLGNEQYELYRAIGLGSVVVLAAIVAVAATGRDEPLWPDRAAAAPETVRGRLASATPVAVGTLLLVATLGGLAGPGIVPNLVTVADGDLPGDPIEVDGYEVTYAEDVDDRVVSVVDVEAFGRTTAVQTSGVIVANPDRAIWTTAVSRGALAYWGERRVAVGGTGWRETVSIRRSGWVTLGGDPTYRVVAAYERERSTLFVSDPASAEARVDGRTVSIAATDRGFELRVDHEGSTERATVPDPSESVTLRGVTFSRTGGVIHAVRGDTRVRVAEREQYEGRRGR